MEKRFERGDRVTAPEHPSYGIGIVKGWTGSMVSVHWPATAVSVAGLWLPEQLRPAR